MSDYKSGNSKGEDELSRLRKNEKIKSKTEREAALQDRIEQLEGVINLQAQIQAKVERETGHESIKLRKVIASLIEDLEGKSRTVEKLQEELSREEHGHSALEISLLNEPGAGHQAHDQTRYPGSTINELGADLLQCKKGLAEGHQREQLYYQCIENQQAEIVELMNTLGIAISELQKTAVELREKRNEPNWLQKQISTCTNTSSGIQQVGCDKARNQITVIGDINPQVIMLQLQADLVESKNESERCYVREKLNLHCIELQRKSAIRLLSKLRISAEEEKKLKNVIHHLQTELQLGISKELKLAEEIEKVKICREKGVSSSTKLIQGLDNTVQKKLSDNRTLYKKLTEAQEENEALLAQVKMLELQISQQIESETTPRAISSTRVLHKKLTNAQEENENLLAQVKNLELQISQVGETMTTKIVESEISRKKSQSNCVGYDEPSDDEIAATIA